MSEIQWTPSQRTAINARGDVLVSAAAGSGKTAVLVQRVMQMIATECDVDELLIVTFTRSAAAQMKEKIAAAIAEKLIQDPNDHHFRRQQILLEKAKITTIDAFCADVLKNNFQFLKEYDISMNYQNMDAAEFTVLSAEVMDEVLEEFYARGDETFYALMDLFTSGKNDLSIYSVLERLHAYTGAFADRHAWMHSKTALYQVDRVAHSVWGKLLMAAVGEKLVLANDYLCTALDIVAADAPTDAVYGAVLTEDAGVIEHMMRAIRNEDWDALFACKNAAFSRYPSVKKGIDEALRAAAKPLRDAAIKTVKNARAYFVENEADFLRDNALILPLAQELEKLFERYEQVLFEKKIQRQSFEFSDIAFLALKVLRKPNGEPTDAALEYRRRIKGILIDEYQDTNGVQDLIFQTIENHNLFVVGDVKQSIYRFRQAMPEIFMDRKKALEPYQPGAASGYVLLKNNFRSEKPITDFVNFLFKKIMSEAVGDVTYNEDEYLIPGENTSDAQAAAVELHILDDVFTEERTKYKKCEFEAHYIAQLIADEVASGKRLQTGGVTKKAEYSDYCVLVRSKTHMSDLEKAFAQKHVPYASVAGDNLFDTAEIMLVMSFLRAIDNPLRDVDLIAVMYSEIFAFTPAELALIRVQKRSGSFYSAVTALAKKGNSKCENFLKQLEVYRTLAATNEPAEFLRKLYRETALPEMMCAAENGKTKRANLYKFVQVVQLYCTNGYYGITGLVRFLEKVKADRTDIPSAFVPENDSKVKLMSVHASKGLEFPVVILAFTNNTNNHYGSNIVLNRELGIGIKPKYPEENVRYNTIAYSAVSLANLRSDMSEEIRTLYVALTRPKSRLIMTGTFEGKIKKNGLTPREDALADIALLSATNDSALHRGWLRENNNYLYWLIACALMHPQAGELRRAAGVDNVKTDAQEQGKFLVRLPDFYPEPEMIESVQMHGSADPTILATIRKNFDFAYDYAGAENIESKITPSALVHEQEEEAFRFEPPAFMLKEKMNAAHRGTATHRFMEKVTHFGAFDFDEQLAQMLEKGFLSAEQAEVLDRKRICTFFKSELCLRMAKATKLVKEYEIAYLEKAGFFDPSLPEHLKNEQVFVDGMLDAAFMENGAAVIVDYKTDRVKDGAELLRRYRKQMQLYRRAIESVWGVPVKECHIYSFELNEDIVLKF